MIDRTWNRMRVSTPIEKRGWGEPYDPRKPLNTHFYPSPATATGVGRGRAARACEGRGHTAQAWCPPWHAVTL